MYELTAEQAAAIASEPAHTKSEREFHEGRITKLENGNRIFRTIMGGGAVAF